MGAEQEAGAVLLHDPKHQGFLRGLNGSLWLGVAPTPPRPQGQGAQSSTGSLQPPGGLSAVTLPLTAGSRALKQVARKTPPPKELQRAMTFLER